LGRKYCILLIALLTSTLRLTAQSYLEFVENKGQWESQVKYQGNLGNSGVFYLEKNGFKVLLHHPDDMRQVLESHHLHTGIHRPDRGPEGVLTQQNSPDILLRSHAYQMNFVGASEGAQIIPDKVLATVSNYFIGNDPSKWASNCKVYQAVTYKNIYPNIDARYYVENGGLKYDLIVYPGGDISKIAMNYAGVDKLSVRNGELIIKTSVGESKELSPYSYQFGSNGKVKIDCKYQVSGNVVKFSIRDYDKNSVLVIDPTLIFSTFTFSATENWGFTATPGPDGSFFAGSIAFGDKYPVTPGAYQTYQNNTGIKKVDIAITRFNPDATARIYSTYLGGTNDEYPHSLFSDAQGNLVVMGRTYSTNYPGTKVGPEGGADIVVTKLNSTGTGVIGSLRIGGSGADGVNIEDQQQTGNDRLNSLIRNYGDDSRSEVILDGAGNIYVAAQTFSSNFPITGTPFQPSIGGKQDGVVMKINPNCNAITWSSFLGGSAEDGAFVLALNPNNNNLYVAGATASVNFPGDKTGVIQNTLLKTATDSIDGYVSIIANDGSAILKTTYLGTNQTDIVYGIQFDRSGMPYVMGVTRGDWPIRNAAYVNAGARQFISKLQPDLSAFIYSTVFGNGNKPNMSPVAFLVDRCENVYISGWGGWLAPTASTDPYDLAGVMGMPITADAIKSTTDNKDFYFFVLKKNATDILYGSFFGQAGGYGEHVDGGTSRFDQQGVIFQAMCANCGGGGPGITFPTTPNVVGPYNPGPGCNLAAVKIHFNFAGVSAGPKPFIRSIGKNQGCIPLTVDFRDTVLNAVSYEWDFDGNGVTDLTTTAGTASYTYNAVGTYRVRLIAVDSNSCNIRDTAYTFVRARDDQALLDFNYAKVGPCESLEFQFTNLSVSPPSKPFTATSFIWDFDDGSPRVVTGTLPINHTFPRAGTYNVKLILPDTNYCNAPDTLVRELRIAPLVKAQFETPPTGCAPYNAVFNNTSIAGREFFWDFGDGTTSTEVHPVHLYPNTGTYTITLRADDTSTCNKTDQTQFTITVHPLPQAAFTFTPVPAEENKPTIFHNGSLGATSFIWLFGDGTSRTKNNMDTTIHQYNKTGIYQACLIAINEFGCRDTICEPVEAIIKPVLDVPNAFTPGRPGNRGKNHIVKPEGFGIGKVMFRIYNRWGQKIFETTTPYHGWDGTYKGVIQPMDVYVYTLEVEFTDGTRAQKKGDITLIR
jgi:gliding motility-associated-like protein